MSETLTIEVLSKPTASGGPVAPSNLGGPTPPPVLPGQPSMGAPWLPPLPGPSPAAPGTSSPRGSGGASPGFDAVAEVQKIMEKEQQRLQVETIRFQLDNEYRQKILAQIDAGEKAQAELRAKLIARAEEGHQHDLKKQRAEMEAILAKRRAEEQDRQEQRMMFAKALMAKAGQIGAGFGAGGLSGGVASTAAAGLEAYLTTRGGLVGQAAMAIAQAITATMEIQHEKITRQGQIAASQVSRPDIEQKWREEEQLRLDVFKKQWGPFGNIAVWWTERQKQLDEDIARAKLREAYVTELAPTLRDVSPDLAVSGAQAQIMDLQERIRESGTLGPELAELERLRTENMIIDRQRAFPQRNKDIQEAIAQEKHRKAEAQAALEKESEAEKAKAIKEAEEKMAKAEGEMERLKIKADLKALLEKIAANTAKDPPSALDSLLAGKVRRPGDGLFDRQGAAARAAAQAPAPALLNIPALRGFKP